MVSRYLWRGLSSNWIVAGGNTSAAAGGTTAGGTRWTTGTAAVVGAGFWLTGGGIATVGTPTRQAGRAGGILATSFRGPGRFDSYTK